MKKYIKYIKKIDVFGTSIELTLNQKKTHKTYFGSFLTICVVIACFLGSRSIGADFIVKKDPDLLFKEIIFEGQDIHQEWQDLDLQFIIKDQVTQQIVNSKMLVDNKILQINILYVSEQPNSNLGQKQELKIKWDNNGDIFRISEESFSQIINFQNIIITFIGDSLNKYSLEINYRQYYFRSDNYEDPFPYTNKQISFLLNNIGIEMVFQEAEVSTDRGFFIPEFYSQFQLLYKERQPLEEIITHEGNTSKLIFSISDVSRFYRRKYLKVQNILAIIGGLLKSLLVVGKFISKPISKLSIRTRLLNELFNFAELLNLHHSQSQLTNVESGEKKQNAKTNNNPDEGDNNLNDKCENKENINKKKDQQDTIENNLKLNNVYNNNINNNNNQGQIKIDQIKDKTPKKPTSQDKNKAKIQKRETQYFENILDLGNVALNRRKSNIFQIQLQNQIEKNIVSQKSIQSKKNYVNQNSKASNFSFQSPGKMAQQQFSYGSKILAQNQINMYSSHQYNKIQSNETNLSKTPQNHPGLIKNQKTFEMAQMINQQNDRKQFFEANPSSNNSLRSDNNNKKQQNPSNFMLQQKKSQMSKRKNSMKIEIFEISEAPQEQEYISKVQTHSAKVERSGQFFFSQSPPQLLPIKKQDVQQDQSILNSNDQLQIDSKIDKNYLHRMYDSENRQNAQQRKRNQNQSSLQKNEINLFSQKKEKIEDEYQIQNQKEILQDQFQLLQIQRDASIGINLKETATLQDFTQVESQTNQTHMDNQTCSNLLQIQLLSNKNISNKNETNLMLQPIIQNNAAQLIEEHLKKGVDEENLLILKKQNTQFITDIIQIRAKERTKTGWGGDLSAAQDASHQVKGVHDKTNKDENRQSLKDKNNELDKPKQNTVDESQNRNPSNRPSTNHESQKLQKQFDKAIENKQTNTLKLGFLDYIKYFVFKKDKKKTQINYCMKKVKQRLDIIYILNKLVEIDKLKMLLLDHNQRELFEFLPRPVVLQKQNTDINDLNDRYNIQEAWSLLQEEKNMIDKATDACISYKIMSSKRKRNVLDDRLLEMLDINIRHVFDQTDIPHEIIEVKKEQNQFHQNLHNRQNQLFNMHEKKLQKQEQLHTQQDQHHQQAQNNMNNQNQKAQHKINMDDIFCAYNETYQPSGLTPQSLYDKPQSLQDKKMSVLTGSEPRYNRHKELMQQLELQKQQSYQKVRDQVRHFSSNSRNHQSYENFSEVNSAEGTNKARIPYNKEIKQSQFIKQIIPQNLYHDFLQEQQNYYNQQENQEQLQNQLNPNHLQIKNKHPPARIASNFSFQPQLPSTGFQPSNEQPSFSLTFSSQQKMSTGSNQLYSQDPYTPYIGEGNNNKINQNIQKPQLNQKLILSPRNASKKNTPKNNDSFHSIMDTVPEENIKYQEQSIPMSQITAKLQSLPQKILQMQIQRKSLDFVNQNQLDKLDDLIERNQSILIQMKDHNKEQGNIQDTKRTEKSSLNQHSYNTNKDLIHTVNDEILNETSSEEESIGQGIIQNSNSSISILEKDLNKSPQQSSPKRKKQSLSKSYDSSQKQIEDQSNNYQNIIFKDNMNLNEFYKSGKPIKSSIFNQK